MGKDLILGLIFCSGLFVALYLAQANHHRTVMACLNRIPAENYGEQICWFVVDGNTIDLGYEGSRWRNVRFYDGEGRKIGDFTRQSNGGMLWKVEVIGPKFLANIKEFTEELDQ